MNARGLVNTASGLKTCLNCQQYTCTLKTILQQCMSNSSPQGYVFLPKTNPHGYHKEFYEITKTCVLQFLHQCIDKLFIFDGKITNCAISFNKIVLLLLITYFSFATKYLRYFIVILLL